MKYLLTLLMLLPSIAGAQVRANVSNVVVDAFDPYGRFVSSGDSAVMWDEIIIVPANVKNQPIIFKA
jgi:hypothetical protein